MPLSATSRESAPKKTAAGNAIDVASLAKSYGKQVALAGITIQLRVGEILGLLGPNGAGKTTLLRAILGRVAPDSGSILIFGKPLGSDHAGSRPGLGWVTQELALYPLLTARENLATFGRYQGMSKKDLNASVEKCLSWAALTDRANEPI